jgi:hypothetical protein
VNSIGITASSNQFWLLGKSCNFCRTDPSISHEGIHLLGNVLATFFGVATTGADRFGVK